MTAPLLCPECGKRIGNMRTSCGTCNRHASRLRTALAKHLRTQFDGNLAAITATLEQDLYTQTTYIPKQHQ